MSFRGRGVPFRYNGNASKGNGSARKTAAPQMLARARSHFDAQIAAFPSTSEVEERVNSKLPANLLNTLFPFQKTAVVEAVKRRGRILIADEMGLGKCIQAIAILSFYSSPTDMDVVSPPALILCPSSIRLTWRAELTKWLNITDPQTSIQVVKSSKDVIRSNLRYLIINYDLVSKPAILAQIQHISAIVADESHVLKNKDTQRSKAVLPLLKKASPMILLTGTPALSRPVELYTQLCALTPHLLEYCWRDFTVRFCNGRQGVFGWDATGKSNLDELNWWFLQVGVRRLKKDVLKDLPPKTRQCVVLELPSKSLKKIAGLRADALKAGSIVDPREREAKKREIMSLLYTETGQAKIDPVVEYVQELLETTDKKMLIFGHHLSMLDGLSAFLTKANVKFIRIDGSNTLNQRQDACDSFQTDAEVRVGVLSIMAAGVGLTLHEADLVIFAELFWTPASILQAEDRAHRIGRRGCVDVKFLLADGSFDDTMWPMVNKKLDTLGRMLDGQADMQMTSSNQTQRLEHIPKVESETIVIPDEDAALSLFLLDTESVFLNDESHLPRTPLKGSITSSTPKSIKHTSLKGKTTETASDPQPSNRFPLSNNMEDSKKPAQKQQPALFSIFQKRPLLDTIDDDIEVVSSSTPKKQKRIEKITLDESGDEELS